MLITNAQCLTPATVVLITWHCLTIKQNLSHEIAHLSNHVSFLIVLDSGAKQVLIILLILISVSFYFYNSLIFIWGFRFDT